MNIELQLGTVTKLLDAVSVSLASDALDAALIQSEMLVFDAQILHAAIKKQIEKNRVVTTIENVLADGSIAETFSTFDSALVIAKKALDDIAVIVGDHSPLNERYGYPVDHILITVKSAGGAIVQSVVPVEYDKGGSKIKNVKKLRDSLISSHDLAVNTARK